MYNIIQMIFIMFLAVSCTHPWMGKKLPVANYPEFSNGLEGHHTIKFEGGNATLDYDWVTNEEKNHIWLVGTFDINVPEFQYATKSTFKDLNIVFKVFHLDKNYKIIGVDHIFIPLGNESTEKDYRFKKEFLYKKEYKYVSYRLEASGKF